MSKLLIAGGKTEEPKSITDQIFLSTLSYNESNHEETINLEVTKDYEPLPYKLMLHAACFGDDQLCIFGGYKGAEMVTQSHFYSKDNKKWQALPDIPNKQSGQASVFMNGNAIICGGYDENACLSLSLKQPDKYVTLPEMERERYRLKLTKVDENCMYASGGWSSSYSLDSMEFLDLRTDSWSRCPDMPGTRHGHSVAYCEKSQRIYSLGGCNRGRFVLDDFSCFDVRAQTWTSLPALPVARLGLYSMIGKDKIYAIGGMLENKSSYDNIDVYDINEKTWKQTNISLPFSGISQGESMALS